MGELLHRLELSPYNDVHRRWIVCIYNATMMNNLIVSPSVRQKLREKHDVDVREVEQAFENKCGFYLEDVREDHKTDPATLWFIAPTNRGRMLKVIFIFIEGNVHIKSAFEPHEEAIAIYERHGK